MNHAEHGKFIELHWEYEPEAYYVRGHVTPEQFAAAVAPYYGNEVASDLVVKTVEHSFARWIPTPHGDNDRVIRDEPERKRGSFAVTVVRVPRDPRPWWRQGVY